MKYSPRILTAVVAFATLTSAPAAVGPKAADRAAEAKKAIAAKKAAASKGKNKKGNAPTPASLVSDMEKAVAFIAKSAGESKPAINPKAKDARPFWKGLQTIAEGVDADIQTPVAPAVRPYYSVDHFDYELGLGLTLLLGFVTTACGFLLLGKASRDTLQQLNAQPQGGLVLGIADHLGSPGEFIDFLHGFAPRLAEHPVAGQTLQGDHQKKTKRRKGGKFAHPLAMLANDVGLAIHLVGQKNQDPSDEG
jgi:hypothetical protein